MEMIEPTIREAFDRASRRAMAYLQTKLFDGPGHGPQREDLGAFYKAPYLFLACGDLRAAQQCLDQVKARFMDADGDFLTRPGLKSENAAFQEYWAYPNGWLVIAAQKAGRFDVSRPGGRYLERFHSAAHDGFVTRNPRAADGAVLDVLTNAHLGLVALYLGDLEPARSAARFLARCAERQPNIARDFYLHLDESGNPVTKFPASTAMFHRVSANEPQQAYFMLGYPMAFLGKLHQATGDATYLATARHYLAFALTCGEALRECHFSHKVAWGGAILARITGDEAAARLAVAIGGFLLGTQHECGAWLPKESAIVACDQTAEAAIWLREIGGELG